MTDRPATQSPAVDIDALLADPFLTAMKGVQADVPPDPDWYDILTTDDADADEETAREVWVEGGPDNLAVARRIWGGVKGLRAYLAEHPTDEACPDDETDPDDDWDGYDRAPLRPYRGLRQDILLQAGAGLLILSAVALVTGWVDGAAGMALAGLPLTAGALFRAWRHLRVTS